MCVENPRCVPVPTKKTASSTIGLRASSLALAEVASSGHRQRLRERFIGSADVARSEESLLELLLCYAIPRRDVGPLANALISQFGSLPDVLAANLTDLR